MKFVRKRTGFSFKPRLLVTIVVMFLVVFTNSELLTFVPLAAGQPYGGDTGSNHPPYIRFSLENGTEIYTIGNYNVLFVVVVGGPSNVMWMGSSLYSVSYKASWEDKINVVYECSINDPADLDDDDPNRQMVFRYAVDLTDVPEGSHQIEVIVEGGGYLFGGDHYATFSSNGGSLFQFSVVAPPSPPAASDPSNVSSAWDIQTITDVGAGARNYNSPLLVLDSNDVPHVAYSKLLDYPESNTRLTTYASWNGVGWTSQTVGVGSPNSLVLDDNNVPHLLYGTINYATLDGTKWVTQDVETSITSGLGCCFGALALDSSGKPHVAYANGTNLLYRRKTESSWETQIVDTIELDYVAPFHVSLAVNQDDAVFILYGYPSTHEDENTIKSYSTEIIKLAVYKDSNWRIETIPLPHPINGYGNLVLDSKGIPHFICSQEQLPSMRPSRSNVLYVSKNGIKWDIQGVVSNVRLGIYSESQVWVNMGSLALDSHDYPKICYVAESENESAHYTNLVYAGWNGISWDIHTVATNLQSKPGSLALDSNNNPHITYLGPQSRLNWDTLRSSDVMYATSTMANGSAEPELSIIVVTIAIILIVIGIGLLVYFKKRKH